MVHFLSKRHLCEDFPREVYPPEIDCIDTETDGVENVPPASDMAMVYFDIFFGI